MFCGFVFLNYLQVEKPFYLQTDASDVALCAILFQLDENGNSCPIIYASRILKGAELAYYIYYWKGIVGDSMGPTKISFLYNGR